ncbi:peroxisome biogenesis factor 10 [Neocloeon triangulifer]|uniref:peroxisome biogenesis factor 10 n=1 Tax=Neocloeon triangulifer TaxID=2078957 RepID=UPI00286F0058|nr:peroxisome biogenesis factor 10 [Neocloeon triangulifer]
MGSLTRAGRAEILRSAQKDDEFCQELHDEISQVTGEITGHRLWVARNKTIFDGLSKFIYKYFTTLKNLQTLGEEYTGIVQLDSSGRNLPSKFQFFLSVMIESCGPLATFVALQQMEKRIKESKQINPLEKEKFLNYLAAARALAPFLQQFHKTFFYLFGIYYNFSKRCTGISYALVRPWMRDNGTRKTFHWIGIASSLYLVISFVHSLRSGHFLKYQNDGGRDRKISRHCDPLKKCSLCLEEMREVSCTPCGHLFCWECILEWLNSKTECPLCREPFQPSRVVRLQNYDTSCLV